ncbi:MAG: hybrid sensor histidine kinase/response regulator [Verrucomicrobiota bacterium]
MLDRLPHTDAPSLVLVVDDEPKNVQVVGALLLKHGHEVIAANSGQEALAKLEFAKPDLILLDVMMPGMTGFELCHILLENPATRDIPIIFLSAAADKSFVTEALQHGAVDYITKPFHGAELLIRVDLHSNLQKIRRRLAKTITEKNRLLEIVAHDLKNPLSGIQFAAQMLAEKSTGENPRQDMIVDSIHDSTKRAFEIIANLLATPGLDEVKSSIRKEPVCLKHSALQALKSFEPHVRSKDIQLDLRVPEKSVIVVGEDRTLRCCMENLISNAIKFSPKGASVRIQVLPDAGEFRIEDQGPGIQADEIPSMFQKFTRLSARPTAGEPSTGLGLHIVHELISAMQGSVIYEKSGLGGACFTLKLPLAGEFR